jgi:hypothetical protein
MNRATRTDDPAAGVCTPAARVGIVAAGVVYGVARGPEADGAAGLFIPGRDRAEDLALYPSAGRGRIIIMGVARSYGAAVCLKTRVDIIISTSIIILA